MHAKMILPVLPVQAHRIVQILRVLPVYGHHGKLPQIQPGRKLLPGRRTVRGRRLPARSIRRALRFRQRLRREGVRDAAAFYDGKDIHTRIVYMAQDLSDPSLGAFPRAAVIRDRNDYLGSGNRASRLFSRHKNISSEPAVVRNHKSEAFILLVGPYHTGHSTRQDADHLRLLSSARKASQQTDLHRILMESALRLRRRNIEVVLPPLHLHEAETPGMADEGTDHRLPIRNGISSPPVDLNPSFQDQLLQKTFQLRPVLRAHLHQAGQLLFLHGNIGRLLQEGDDLLFSVFIQPNVKTARQALSSVFLSLFSPFCAVLSPAPAAAPPGGRVISEKAPFPQR